MSFTVSINRSKTGRATELKLWICLQKYPNKPGRTPAVPLSGLLKTCLEVWLMIDLIKQPDLFLKELTL